MFRVAIVSLAALQLASAYAPRMNRARMAARAPLRMSSPFDQEELEDETFRDDVQKLQQKYKGGSLKNENGVAYAPWMDLDEMAIQKAREMRRERKRKEKAAAGELGAMYTDAQGGELAGTGLKKRIVGEVVELEWSTGKEEDTAGFVIMKTPGGERNWQEIASYETWQPLASKGINGGTYTYQDPTTELGTWYYRVSEVNSEGKRSDLCQVLVDVQSEQEKVAGKIAAVGIAGVFLALVAAFAVLDPMQ